MVPRMINSWDSSSTRHWDCFRLIRIDVFNSLPIDVLAFAIEYVARGASRLPRLANTLDKRVVIGTGPAQVVDTCRQKSRSPVWREMVKIFEDGRAELVVVRITSFEKDQDSGESHEGNGIGLAFGVCQCHLCCPFTIAINIGKNLFQGGRFGVGE